MEGPLVSVIVPLYNQESYIKETLNSLVRQSHSHWEALVIDDGSTDQSYQKALEVVDPRIRLVRQENQGVSAARNAGLELSKGQYFCFLDADDVFPPESISSRVALFEQNPTLAFVDGKVEIGNADLSEIIGAWQPNFQGTPLSELCALTGTCFMGNSWMFKRPADYSIRFHPQLKQGEDLWFCIQNALAGGEYGYTNETILSYRRGNSSASTNLVGLHQS